MANPNPSPATRFKSGKEAEIKGRKGGKKSGESKRERKLFREAIDQSLTEEEQEKIVNALKLKAMRGDLASIEFLFKFIGQRPEEGPTDTTVTVSFGDEAKRYGV